MRIKRIRKKKPIDLWRPNMNCKFNQLGFQYTEWLTCVFFRSFNPIKLMYEKVLDIFFFLLPILFCQSKKLVVQYIELDVIFPAKQTMLGLDGRVWGANLVSSWVTRDRRERPWCVYSGRWTGKYSTCWPPILYYIEGAVHNYRLYCRQPPTCETLSCNVGTLM